MSYGTFLGDKDFEHWGSHGGGGVLLCRFSPVCILVVSPRHRLVMIPMLNAEDCMVAVVSDFSDLAEVNPSKKIT